MTYGKVRGFLSEHTRVVELSGERGARVAVCPEGQGLVLTAAANQARVGLGRSAPPYSS